MSQSDASAASGPFSGAKPMEADPSMQFRSPWISQTQIALQVELSRLNAVAESLKTQEASLLQKIQELSDMSDASKLQNFSNGTTDMQRQTLLATFHQQLQQVRAEQGQLIHSFNALQRIYSQAPMWPMYAAAANYGGAVESSFALSMPGASASFPNNGPMPIPPLMSMASLFPYGAPNSYALPPAATTFSTTRTASLYITRQPPGTAMVNRFLPKVTVRIDDVAAEERATMFVSVELIDQKRNLRSDALMGITTAQVEEDFSASFSRMKIGDSSSDNNGGDFSPAFVLQFQVMQNLPGRPATPLCAPVRSNPFALIAVSSLGSGLQHSTSGPSLSSSKSLSSMVRSSSSSGNLKRKRGDSDMDEDSGDWDEREMPVSYGASSFSGGVLPRFKRVKSEPTIKESPDSPIDEDAELAARSSPSIFLGQGASRESQSTYVDITDLLSLPQKDAAARLGISESMLCKRFKECTRRKWPYRYLRKVEKQISQLQEQRHVTGFLTAEENNRLESLVQEREDCLAPVRIRVTHHDVAAGSPVAARSLVFGAGGEIVPSFSASSFSTASTATRSNSLSDVGAVPMEADEDDMDISVKVGDADDAGDEDDWDSVAKTLEQLREMRPQSSASLVQ